MLIVLPAALQHVVPDREGFCCHPSTHVFFLCMMHCVTTGSMCAPCARECKPAQGHALAVVPLLSGACLHCGSAVQLRNGLCGLVRHAVEVAGGSAVSWLARIWAPFLILMLP